MTLNHVTFKKGYTYPVLRLIFVCTIYLYVEQGLYIVVPISPSQSVPLTMDRVRYSACQLKTALSVLEPSRIQ